MLALSRKKNESIIVNNDVEITILDIKGDQVKIGINAPKSVPVYRKEVYVQIQEANKAAIPGTEFTLYHATVSEGTWTKGPVVTNAYVTGATSPQGSGIFTTDESGNLSIEIHNKGAYILVETKAATGYYLDANNPPSFPFELIDD